MPLPIGPERIAYAGNTRPLPVPLSRGKIDLGYIGKADTETISGKRVQKATFKFIPVTHALADRTFVYRALVSVTYGEPNCEREVDYDDIKALFIPTNKFRPELDRGVWYYGRDAVVDYLTTNQAKTGIEVLGLLFIDKSSTVHWRGEGLDAAQQLQHIIRPQLSPRDATPFDFRGIYDDCCPDTCDGG